MRISAVSVAVVYLGLSLGSASASADSHYVPLKQFFPTGKCSPVIPYFELLTAAFKGGVRTEYRIADQNGDVVETITTFVNASEDQWVTVNSKTETTVLFCLYASGIGEGSVKRKIIK